MDWFEIKMKRDWVVSCKNWDGKLVHTVSSMNVEHMLCETIPEYDSETPKKIKLKPSEVLTLDNTTYIQF